MGTPADARTNEFGQDHSFLRDLHVEVGHNEGVAYDRETGQYRHKVNGLVGTPHTKRRVFTWDVALASLLVAWS